MQSLFLGDLIRRNALLYANKPAFVMNGREVTFGEHNRRVNRLVHALQRKGIHKGDRIAVLARNCMAYLDVYGAAEKGGYVIAPLNFRLTAGEIRKLMDDVRPRVLFAQERYRDVVGEILNDLPFVDLCVAIDGPADEGWSALDTLLAEGEEREPVVRLSPDDLCYLIFTSGTTGLPRAAMLTHQGQWLDAAALALEMALTPTDWHLAVMPLYHVGGRAIVLAHTLRGCTVVLHDSFDVTRVLTDLESYRISTMQVVPTMVAWLLNEPGRQHHDLSSLRLVWYASAPMPVDLLRRGLDAFGPIFMQGYGQTEAGPLVSSLHPYEHQVDGAGSARLASCGRAVPGVQVRIVDPDDEELPCGEVGEIAVRSPFLMAGYWEKAEATSQVPRDGWLHTGDMARMDPEGYLYIVDRKKDLIISGGENIYPREVEEVLFRHPAVMEAAVIGVPDPIWGESVKALVVLRPDQRVAPDAVLVHCRQHLAGYKCPKSVELRESLPRTPSGKVLKRVLRDEYRYGTVTNGERRESGQRTSRSG